MSPPNFVIRELPGKKDEDNQPAGLRKRVPVGRPVKQDAGLPVREDMDTEVPICEPLHPKSTGTMTRPQFLVRDPSIRKGRAVTKRKPKTELSTIPEDFVQKKPVWFGHQATQGWWRYLIWLIYAPIIWVPIFTPILLFVWMVSASSFELLTIPVLISYVVMVSHWYDDAEHWAGCGLVLGISIGVFFGWIFGSICKEWDIAEDEYIKKTSKPGWFSSRVRHRIVNPSTRWFRKSFIRNYTIAGGLFAFYGCYIVFFVLSDSAKCTRHFGLYDPVKHQCYELIANGMKFADALVEIEKGKQPAQQVLSSEEEFQQRIVDLDQKISDLEKTRENIQAAAASW